MTKDNKWMEWLTRPTFTPLLIEPFTRAYMENVPRVLGTGLTEHLFFSAEEGIKWHVRKKEFKELGKAVMEKTKGEGEFAKRQSERCRETCQKMVNTARNISQMELSDKSDENLFELFEKFLNDFQEFVVYLAIPPAVDDLLTEEVKDGIRETLDKEGETEDYFNDLSWTEKRPESDLQELELLKIASKGAEETSSEINEKIRNHAEKYGWLTTYAFDQEPANEEFFRKKIKEVKNPGKQLKEKREKHEEGKRKFERAMEEIHPDEDLRNLINTLRDYIFLRTYRTDMFRKAFYHIIGLLEEIGNRLGMSRKEISYLTIDELKGGLLQGDLPPRKEVERRVKSFLALKKKGTLEIFSDEEEIADIKNRELEEFAKERVETLSGNGVYEGIEEGRVKKIFGSQDEKKMEENDVLVTNMTTPDMHSIIEKSTAIVTDEGGMTSHAAVVSRELQIPCVIGTGKATKVLEDGQKVKVDGEKGIVEVLE